MAFKADRLGGNRRPMPRSYLSVKVRCPYCGDDADRFHDTDKCGREHQARIDAEMLARKHGIPTEEKR